MRKRTYVGLSLALAMAVSIAAVSQAAVTGQKTEWTPEPSPNKQSASKKERGAVTFGVQTESLYDNIAPDTGTGGAAATPSAHVTRAVVHFDKDLAYNDGSATQVPNCPLASIANVDTAGAKAACPKSILGGGEAKLNGFLGPATAVVTLFKGSVKGQLYLHSRAGAPLNATQVLVGQIGPSSIGGLYGQQLDVTVPPIGGGVEVLLRFQTAVFRTLTVPAGKAKGATSAKKKKKKKKRATFLTMMNCSDKTWNLSGVFTFADGPPPGNDAQERTAVDTAPCTQKPKKKKKK